MIANRPSIFLIPFPNLYYFLLYYIENFLRNKIYFGSYPQTLVVDNDIISELDIIAGNLPTSSYPYSFPVLLGDGEIANAKEVIGGSYRIKLSQYNDAEGAYIVTIEDLSKE